MIKEAIWLDVPIMVKCVRVRCKKPDNYVMIRPLALSLDSYDEAEAPIVLDVLRESNTHSDLLYGKTQTVRQVGEGWCSLPNGIDHKPTESLDTCGAMKAIMDGRSWIDMPFSINTRLVSMRKVDIYPEKDLAIADLMSDLDVDTANETAALTKAFCLVGGKIHRRRAKPTLSVRVRSDLSHYRTQPLSPPGHCAITASLHPEAPNEQGLLSAQSFRADRIDHALEYANRVGSVMGCKASMTSHWEPTSAYATDDDDFDDFLVGLSRRILKQSAPLVGYLPTPEVEQWIRMREIALADSLDRQVFLDAYLAFFMAIHALDATSAANHLAMYMQYDVIRIEIERPAITFFAHAKNRGNPLATLDEIGFLRDVA